jgi:hypothetical protein
VTYGSAFPNPFSIPPKSKVVFSSKKTVAGHSEALKKHKSHLTEMAIERKAFIKFQTSHQNKTRAIGKTELPVSIPLKQFPGGIFIIFGYVY